MRLFAPFVFAAVLALGATGCSVVSELAGRVYGRTVDADWLTVRRDLAYRAGSTDPKHTLDVYLPASVRPGQRWPVVVFVHGGGWTSGDKQLRVGTFRPYDNLARRLALDSVGVVLVNYRLLEAGASGQGRAGTVGLDDQIADVAAATAWVRSNIARYGGDASRVFLMGHSAGAQLAARIALDSAPLRAAGVTATAPVCGVASVSGAGFDLTDRRSIEDDHRYFGARFAPPGTSIARSMPSTPAAWQTEASPATYVGAGAPPFRFFVADGEEASFRQQAERLRARLAAVGVDVPAPTTFHADTHALGALAMSDPKGVVGREVAAFVKQTRCATR